MVRGATSKSCWTCRPPDDQTVGQNLGGHHPIFACRETLLKRHELRFSGTASRWTSPKNKPKP